MAGRPTTSRDRAGPDQDLSNFPEQNPNPMLRIDRGGPLLYSNTAARAVPGLLGKTGRQVAPDLVKAAKRAWTKKVAQKADFFARDRIYNFNVVPVPGEGYVNLYGRDVTEARLARQQAQDLARFPEENPSPVLRVEADGAVLYANPGARALGALWQKGGQRLSHGLSRAVRTARQEGTSRPFELAAGARRFVLTITPVPDADYVNIYGRDVTEERRAQQETQDIAKFPEENPNPVLRASPKGVVLFANAAARSLNGLIGRNRRLAAELSRAARQAFAGRETCVVDFAAGRRCFAFSIMPVAGEAYLNLYGRDVTEERRARQEVDSLARFPEENPNPVLRVAATGKVLYANSAARNLNGLLRNAQKTLTAGLSRSVAEAHAEGRNRLVEFASRDLLYALALTPVPGQEYVNIYGRDITAERRANLEVLRVKNFNQNILDNLSNGILTFDSRLRLTSANPAARTLLALKGDKAIGLGAAKLLGAENAWLHQAMGEMRQAAASKTWMDRDIVARGGRSASVNVTIVPLQEEVASESGLMLVVEDITREKRVKGTMVRFMSDNVVERLLEVDEALLSGTSQEVTVLFSDIRQFARLSEQLGARRMVRVLNAYFSDMVDIIFENGGTLDKFIGDALMAVFGAPFVSSDDTDNALSAAIEMVRRLRDFNAARQREGLLPIDIGIGIDTGPVIAGTIGSPKRMDYTVIGKHVNLAARIEAVNKAYGTRILISQDTKTKLKGDYRLREIDRVQVAGVENPVRIFEALDYHTDDTFPNMGLALEAYAAGLGHYRKRNWSAAAQAFAAALNANPSDRPTQILLSRCWSFKARPPGKAWTGVTNLAG